MSILKKMAARERKRVLAEKQRKRISVNESKEALKPSPAAASLLDALAGGIPPGMTAKQLESFEANIVKNEARYAAMTPEQQKLDDDMCVANDVREIAARFGREAAEKYVAENTPSDNTNVKDRTDYLLALEDTCDEPFFG